MSQMRAMRMELRAIVAAAAVCALVFGLLVTGAGHRMQNGASAGDSRQVGAYTAMCQHFGLHKDVGDSSTPSGKGSGGGHAQCPNCCLAALVVSAVMPQRIATFLRPERTAEPVVYFALATNIFETHVTGSVNGARAPPASSSSS
jgi:hypothetical protein